MSKTTPSPILTKLAGKTVYLAGRFDRGVKERLTELVEAQQGKLAVVLDARTDYLVIADLAAGKTVQKEAATLNAKKNAAIQTIDADRFRQMLKPTLDELLQLIRGGSANADIFNKAIAPFPQTAIVGERFDNLDLRGFRIACVFFERCSFVGATLTKVQFQTARDCEFDRAVADGCRFQDVSGSRFHDANARGAHFHGIFSRVDLNGAMLDDTHWYDAVHFHSRSSKTTAVDCTFTKASLRKARFTNLSLPSAVFDAADLSESIFTTSSLDSASFLKAKLIGATLVGCTLPNANLSGADCRSANFAEADLTDAQFAGCDLADANTRGAKLGNADMSLAKNFSPHTVIVPGVCPALNELDTLSQSAKRIKVAFKVRTDPNEDGEDVGIDTMGLKYGWGIIFPRSLLAARIPHQPNRSFSDALRTLANLVGTRKVRYETVDIQSSKSPKGGKELRDIVMSAVAEAFDEPIPPADKLAAATKAYRAQIKEQTAVARERREAAKKLMAKQQATAKRQIAVKIAKTVGSVTDIATFLKALELRADKSKIDKATKMLKAEKFQLFKDITDTHLNGVVKSQTDADLVYACRIEPGGKYACCTQNLNICGGLRGSICKHLLVLIIGLVKSGELDPSTIDGWIARTHDAKPELDKEIMGEIFIRYKGAEAGEVDWRPTETVPEDYYAV